MGLYRAKCDRCNFEQKISGLPRYYRLSAGVVIHVETEWAWCASCESVVPSEKIRSLEDVQRELDALVAREPDMVEWVRDLALPSGDFEATYQREVAQFTSRRDWRQSRQSLPRCLECGGTAITPFVWRDTDDDLDAEEFETIEHPSCGGRIHLRCVGLVRPAVVFYYTPEGLRYDDHAV